MEELHIWEPSDPCAHGKTDAKPMMMMMMNGKHNVNININVIAFFGLNLSYMQIYKDNLGWGFLEISISLYCKVAVLKAKVKSAKET